MYGTTRAIGIVLISLLVGACAAETAPGGAVEAEKADGAGRRIVATWSGLNLALNRHISNGICHGPYASTYDQHRERLSSTDFYSTSAGDTVGRFVDDALDEYFEEGGFEITTVGLGAALVGQAIVGAAVSLDELATPALYQRILRELIANPRTATAVRAMQAAGWSDDLIGWHVVSRGLTRATLAQGTRVSGALSSGTILRSRAVQLMRWASGPFFNFMARVSKGVLYHSTLCQGLNWWGSFYESIHDWAVGGGELPAPDGPRNRSLRGGVDDVSLEDFVCSAFVAPGAPEGLESPPNDVIDCKSFE